MTAADDLRIIAEMADEIEKRGRCLFFPASLCRRVSTEHGKRVAAMIAKLSLERLNYMRTAEHLQQNRDATISGLRDEMQRLTDRLLELERR